MAVIRNRFAPVVWLTVGIAVFIVLSGSGLIYSISLWKNLRPSSPSDPADRSGSIIYQTSIRLKTTVLIAITATMIGFSLFLALLLNRIRRPGSRYGL